MIKIALFGWIPVVLAMFWLLPPRRAALAGFMGAWLFLPMAFINVPVLPEYNKAAAATYGVCLGILLFDTGRPLTFRPSWWDLPAVIWCVWPAVSALAMQQGAWEAGSAVFSQVVVWGLPYFVGRLYFREPGALRDLAITLVIGGLIYVPLCLIEVRFSPQLHRWVYGYHQHSFGQAIRDGGFRPMVFMQHGLAVAGWMISASVIAFWLWDRKVIRHLWGLPMWAMTASLFITSILCKSTGALILLAWGVGGLLAMKWTRLALPILALALIPPVYMVARSQNWMQRDDLVEFASELINEDRAASLYTRLYNEDQLIAKALKRPLVGWGRMGDARIKDSKGNDISTVDGLWVIATGNTGVVGTIAVTAMILLPAVLVFYRYRGAGLVATATAPEIALAVVLILHAIDNLLNAMVNPLFILAAGALTSAMVARLRLRAGAADTPTATASTPRRSPAATPTPTGAATLSPPKP